MTGFMTIFQKKEQISVPEALPSYGKEHKITEIILTGKPLAKSRPRFVRRGSFVKVYDGMEKEKKAVQLNGGKIIFTKSNLKSSSKSLFFSNLIYPMN